MAPSRFQIDWPTVQLFLITVLAFVIGMAGCGPLANTMSLPATASVPTELVPFQGAWKYDAARSAIANGASTEELSAEGQKFLDTMKALGVGMSDIEIRGTQITQQGGLLQAQYDLLNYRTEEGRIVGTALWHEDRHDPGDASEIKVTLELSGDALIFTCEDDGFTSRYYFNR
jgi:hypothetical protein